MNKITKIRAELPNFSPDDIVLSFTEQLDSPRFNTALDCFIPTTETELRGLILKSAKKSCCLDPIPASLLVQCFDDLLPIITRIINLLKQAVLSPLLKKPLLDHELYPNFRPVSNLKFISKATEKVASVHFLDHSHENGLQECLQSYPHTRNITVVKLPWFVYRMIFFVLLTTIAVSFFYYLTCLPPLIRWTIQFF